MTLCFSLMEPKYFSYYYQEKHILRKWIKDHDRIAKTINIQANG